MKANSVGLELDIYLSSSEVMILKHKSLEGILQFREINSNSKKPIPLTIKYISGKEESIIVNHNPPKEYFGDANHITIELQDYLYGCLVERGSCGDRFLGSGKVLIYTL